MKKILFIALFSLCTLAVYGQAPEKPKLLKYVSTGPDGSVVFTVIDDSRKPTISIESVDEFYKYQLVDLKTGSVVLTRANKGTTGSIEKSKLLAGDYNLLIYTKSFIIGSEITIQPMTTTREVLAVNDTDEN